MIRKSSVIILVVLSIILALFFSFTGCSHGNKYSKFGFSFEYPDGYRPPSETGLFGPQANATAGVVEVRYTSVLYNKSFQVIWHQRSREYYQSIDTLNNDLDDLFKGLESMNSTEVVRGQKIEITLRKDPLVYQTYNVTVQDYEPQYGVQAVLYCSTSQKWFSLKTFSDAYAADSVLVDEFMSFANTFKCH